ncbi:MAG: ComF family protein [Deltaproteobacteria bacterium]|nr:ComF family protein [Deltaproteobacteria bacterium]
MIRRESLMRPHAVLLEKARSLPAGKAVSWWWAPFRDALFPPRCLICGVFHDSRPDPDQVRGTDAMDDSRLFKTPFADGMAHVLGSFACPVCMPEFIPIASPLCPVCGVMFPGGQGPDHLCPACDKTVRAFGKARALGAYEQGWMKAVHRLKYDGKIQLGRPLGLLLFSAFCRIWETDPVDRIIPVPLNRRRLKERGFNQAWLLVRDWPRYSRKTGRPDFEYRISDDVLVRTRWERSQTGLGKKERAAGIRDAFAVKSPAKVKGERILLVDDVHTTGATVEACATALTRAGARQVDVLTLARTL